MDVNVKMTNPLFARKFANACTKAENVTAQQILKDTAPFVPFRAGILNSSSGVDGNVIYYRTPYARFLYYGKVMVDPQTGSPFARKGATKVLTDRDLVFNQSFHQDATSHWMDASLAINKDKWERVAAKAIEHYGNE